MLLACAATVTFATIKQSEKGKNAEGEKSVNIFEQVNSFGESDIADAAGLKLAQDGKSWICPLCGNGSNGGKGDGIRQKLRKGRLNWWCPRCEANMSNVDVIAVAYGLEVSDKAELGKKLEELFPKAKTFSPLRDKDTLRVSRDAARAAQDAAGRKDYSRMYEICRRALSGFLATRRGTWRGLTNETLHEAGAGYNASYRGKPVMILPYDEGTFFWRAIEGLDKGVNVGGKRRLYEALPLKTGKGKLNFLTEGEIDALSLKQAFSSFKEDFGVASTGSISFTDMLVRELEVCYSAREEKPRFVWLGDNDKRGVEGAAKMVQALKEAGYPAVSVFFGTETAEKVDANKYLQDNGTEALTRWLLEVVDNSEPELDRLMRGIKKATAQAHGISVCSLADYMVDDFDEELDRVSSYASRATGFENLDEVQIFLPGLYVLGGSPGVGKTTFAWQLLSQLAEGDEFTGRGAEHCVYCSYEMSRLELASKSIAREMCRQRLAHKVEGLCIASADIRRGNGRNTQEFKAAKEKFQKTAQKLRVAELSNTTLSELLVMLKEEANSAGDKSLTVAIDYLQLIPVENPKATAKERIDEIMLSLKTFQRETNATIILLSALNREGNKGMSNALFSFKESGAIEYSADVTWHLGFPFESEEEQKILPRRVELKCMKNRNGATYKVEFEYYADSDYFCPCGVGFKPDGDFKGGTKKKKTNRH